MAITAGIGSSGPKNPVLRLTLSKEDLAAYRLRWATDRLSWRAERKADHWELIFTASAEGTRGSVKNLNVGPDGAEREYLTWTWSGRRNTTLRALPRLGRVLWSRWNDQGELVVGVSGDPLPLAPLKPRDPRRAPIPAPAKRLSDSAAARLAALRTTLNHAIRELKAQGLPVRVTQAQAGGDVDMLIKF